MEKDIYCGNCGKLKQDHWVVNFADGQMVSGVVLICPSAIFIPGRKPGMITVKRSYSNTVERITEKIK